MFNLTNPKPVSVDSVLSSLTNLIDDLMKVRTEQGDIIVVQAGIIADAEDAKEAANNEYARANAVAQKISALIE
jgi:hypothetical protein